MGERQGEGGGPGRRRVHHGGTVSGPGPRPDGPDLHVLLADALRPGAVDSEGERRAVAAFRDARDAGTYRARTRRRDDWRPRAHARVRRSLKATLTLSLAGLTLGGVAFAAIGTVGSSHHADSPRTRPSASVTRTPSTRPSVTASAAKDRPATAKDTEAHCRAYEKVKGNGKALESTAWQRLISAAGGETKVAAYCAGQLGGQTTPTTGTPNGKDKETGGPAKSGKAKNAGKGHGKNG
ncbi:hypothetical protein ACIRVK_30310 [Streptomyces sp. NPDC101152]|uniref:hypothetical protein n=1 Tax=Streptomyces sp. NPDC101152 TaxID=3366116 RepID=UPI003813589B